MMCSENPVQFQPSFEGCYSFTPNDLNELLSFIDSDPETRSGSNDMNREPSEENNTASQHNEDNNVGNERKVRRMMSNRLSARRSRWRKKRHFEDLTVEMNRLKVMNQEMKTRFKLVTCEWHVVMRANEQLKCEGILLKRRLSHLYQSLLAIQHVPLNNSLVTNYTHNG